MSAKRRPPTARDQVYEALRERMRRSGVGPGPWTRAAGDEAIEKIAESVEQVLRHRLGELDVGDVVGWAASEMAAAVDARYRARTTLRPNLTTARAAQFHTENATAGQVVLELAARHPVERVSRAPTPRDFQAVAILAHELWRWRTVADRVSAGLVSVTSARLTRRGTFDVTIADRPPFLWSHFESALLRRMADVGPKRAPGDAARVEEIKRSLKGGVDLPDELVDIDSALRADRGHTLIDLLAVQELLIRLAGGDDDGLSGYLTRNGFAGLDEVLADNLSQLTPHASLAGARSALRRLVWAQEEMQNAPLELSQFRETPARLYSRPVIELSDGSMFVPRNAAGLARLVLIQRILEGTWPEELGTEDRTLARALESRRQRVRPILEFERELERTLIAAGLPHAVGVGTSGPGKPSPVLGVPVRAELDAVVLTPETGTIWVIEAKDLAVPFSPRRIRSELDKYLRPRGHVAKLDAKISDVAARPDIVAARLGYNGDAARLTVRGVFVTRELTPAAFVDGLAHEFVTIDRLRGLLSRP